MRFVMCFNGIRCGGMDGFMGRVFFMFGGKR